MTRKLSCLYDCGCTLYDEDDDELATRMRRHLRSEHRLAADPQELKALTMPARSHRAAGPPT